MINHDALYPSQRRSHPNNIIVIISNSTSLQKISIKREYKVGNAHPNTKFVLNYFDIQQNLPITNI
jgi:hypothetical protein